MRKTFDSELHELGTEMIDMAAAAEDAIDLVTSSLASPDRRQAHQAIDLTHTMDQMERSIENRCLRLLLQQQPVARDLRTISAALKMVTDLQRIGGKDTLLFLRRQAVFPVSGRTYGKAVWPVPWHRPCAVCAVSAGL